jgi:hypothetical protein
VIVALLLGSFSQIEFAWTGRICGGVGAVSVRDASQDSQTLKRRSILEFLAAPARAWLVPADFLPGDGRCGLAHCGREVRHLVERQSCATDVDLGLLAQTLPTELTLCDTSTVSALRFAQLFAAAPPG